VIDVGTGGGLPGLPMAIANPDTQFTLLDSNSKKMKIVQNMVDIMNLNNVIVVCCRAEEHQGEYNFIIGRGVSAIPNFLTYSSHLLKSSSPVESPKLVTSGLLYLKGGDFTEELEAINISKNDIIMTPVKELLPGLNSEKFVLYIPAIPIHEFNRNLVMRLSTETNNRNFKSSKKI
jgi:16S rRNA (guanine(527)-N(7))-methyltransferase RsmG